jgi:hypothetical protein
MILKWIQRAMLVLVALGSLYGSLQNLVSTGTLGSTTDDPVADWEKRFQPIKKEIPFVRGAVGYISDSGIAGIHSDPANDLGEYVLTQYVMAPIVIIKGTDQEWNIANLSIPAYRAWSITNQGQFEVTAFNGGLYLLHKIQR